MPESSFERAAADYPSWIAQGRLDEGRTRLTALLAEDGPRDATRAKLLCGAGMFAFLQGDEREARRLQEESLALARELADRDREADALIGLARVSILARDGAAMERYARASLELARDPARVGTALHHVAESLRRQGRLADATPAYERAIAYAREHGDTRTEALALHNFGSLARVAGDHDVAAARYRESLTLALELGHERLVAYCLLSLASLSPDPADAARKLADSDAILARLGASLEPELRDLRATLTR